MADPRTGWTRISMPSLPCVLLLELFLSGVSGDLIPDPVKARGKVLLPLLAPQRPRPSQSKPQVPVGVSPSAGLPAVPGSCHLLGTFPAGWPESRQGPAAWWHHACWQGHPLHVPPRLLASPWCSPSPVRLWEVVAPARRTGAA